MLSCDVILTQSKSIMQLISLNQILTICMPVKCEPKLSLQFTESIVNTLSWLDMGLLCNLGLEREELC